MFSTRVQSPGWGERIKMRQETSQQLTKRSLLDACTISARKIKTCCWHVKTQYCQLGLFCHVAATLFIHASSNARSKTPGARAHNRAANRTRKKPSLSRRARQRGRERSERPVSRVEREIYMYIFIYIYIHSTAYSVCPEFLLPRRLQVFTLASYVVRQKRNTWKLSTVLVVTREFLTHKHTRRSLPWRRHTDTKLRKKNMRKPDPMMSKKIKYLLPHPFIPSLFLASLYTEAFNLINTVLTFPTNSPAVEKLTSCNFWILLSYCLEGKAGCRSV